ncbi:hypothetical protein HMPREF0262_03391 [Clostridium sp. ATCC 29733]|nr:hypothetical protein HMPREF0262_03391 [Clostridium sp. ATCC 29733]
MEGVALADDPENPHKYALLPAFPLALFPILYYYIVRKCVRQQTRTGEKSIEGELFS